MKPPENQHPYFMKKLPKHICFIIAMAGEAGPLIELFGLREHPHIFASYLPMKAYTGQYLDSNISLIINGKDERYDIDNIGTQPAVLSTYLAIQQFDPDLVINAGTAGGLKNNGLQIGDVVLAIDRVWFHDRRIPIPKFREYGLGGYPLEPQPELIRKLGLKTGILSSGNAFDFSEQDRDIMLSLGVSIKDMEAASVAWICDLAKKPLMILKGITDFVGLDHPSEQEFILNFQLTMKNLTDTCEKVLHFLLTNRNE